MTEFLKQIFGSFKDAVQKVRGAIAKIKKLAAFFVTGIGQVVLFLIGIILLALFVYIIAGTMFYTIAEALGYDYAASEYNKDSEFIQSLTLSGYGPMLDAEDFISYYAFEHSVLMDAARFMEDTGTTVFRKYNLSQVDCSKLNRMEWAILAAACLQGATADTDGGFSSMEDLGLPAGLANSISGKANMGEEDSGSDEYTTDFVNMSASQGLFYRQEENDYTGDIALVPYLQVPRYDENLTYFLEIKGEEELYDVIQQKGVDFTVDDIGGLRLFGNGEMRFNGKVTNGASLSEAAQFIYEHVFAVMFNKDLNQSNKACFTLLDSRFKQGSKQILDMYIEYPETLFYWDFRTNLVFKIPLRNLLDRFLPNAELLSSWRYLNDEETNHSTGLSTSETIVREIQKIYTEACLEGEGYSAQNYLLKDLNAVTEGFELGDTAIDVTSEQRNMYYTLIPAQNGSSGVRGNSYEALFDTRKLKSNPKDSDSLRESGQSFGGSYKDDFMNDVELAIRQFSEDFGTDVSNLLSEVESKANVSEENPGTNQEINIYKPNSSGKYLVCCEEIKKQLGVLNKDYAVIRDHFGIPDDVNITGITQHEDGTTSVETSSGTYSHKYADDPSKAPQGYAKCFVPAISVFALFDQKDGLRTTSVVINNNGSTGAYVIKGKEAADASSASNGETFAKFEANQVQSNTFRNWDIATASGGSSSGTSSSGITSGGSSSSSSTGSSTGGSTGSSTGGSSGGGANAKKPGKNSSYEFWIVKDFFEGYNLDIPNSLDANVSFKVNYDYKQPYIGRQEQEVDLSDDLKNLGLAIQQACIEEWDKEKIEKQPQVALENHEYKGYEEELKLTNEERINNTVNEGGMFTYRRGGIEIGNKGDRFVPVPELEGGSTDYRNFGETGANSWKETYKAKDDNYGYYVKNENNTSDTPYEKHHVTFDTDQKYIDEFKRCVINMFKPSGECCMEDFIFAGSYAILREADAQTGGGGDYNEGRIYSPESRYPTENAAPKEGLPLRKRWNL